MEGPLTNPEEAPERPIRISARLSAQSRLSPEELERTIGEVKTAAEEEMARLSHPFAPPVSWYRRPAVAVALLVAAVAVWVVQLWIWKPQGREPSAREIEGGLRFRVAMQAARIEDFRERRGRLPTSLKETEEVLPGIMYVLLDTARYRLTARDSTQMVSWQSDSSLSKFLGSSLIEMRDRKLK